MTIYNNLHSCIQNKFEQIDNQLKTGRCDLVELNHSISELNKITVFPEWLLRLKDCKDKLKILITNTSAPPPSITIQNIKDDEDLKNVITQIERVLNSQAAAQASSIISLRIEKIEEYLGGKIEQIFNFEAIQEQFKQIESQFSQYDIKSLYGRVSVLENNIQLLHKKLNDYIEILAEGKVIEELDSQKLEEELQTYYAEIQTISKYKTIPCIDKLFISIQKLNDHIGNNLVTSNTDAQQDFTREKFLNEIRLLNNVLESEIWKNNNSDLLKVSLQKRVKNLNNYLGREGNFPEPNSLLVQVNEIKELIKKASILNKENSVPVDYAQLEQLFTQKQNPKIQGIIARFLKGLDPFQKFFPEMLRHFLFNNTKSDVDSRLKTIIESNTENLDTKNVPEKSLNEIKEKASAQINKCLNEIDLHSIQNREDLHKIMQQKLKENLNLSNELLNLMIPTSEILNMSNLTDLSFMANHAIFIFYSMLGSKDQRSLKNILETLFLPKDWFNGGLSISAFQKSILPECFLAFIIFELQSYYKKDLSFASLLKVLTIFKGLPEKAFTNFYNKFIKTQNSIWNFDVERNLPDYYQQINEFLFRVKSQSQSPEFQEYLTTLFTNQIFEIEYFKKLINEKLINTTKDKITSILNELDLTETSPDVIKQCLLENPSLTKMDKDIFIEALKQISTNLINNHPFSHIDSFNWQKLFTDLIEAPKTYSQNDSKRSATRTIIRIASNFSKYSEDRHDPNHKHFSQSTIDQFTLNNISEKTFLNPLLKAKICKEILMDLSLNENPIQINNWIERAQLWIESYNFPGKPLSAVFDFIKNNPSNLELTYLSLFLNSDTFLLIHELSQFKTILSQVINHENPHIKEFLSYLSQEFFDYGTNIISNLEEELSSKTKSLSLKTKSLLECSPKEIYEQTEKKITEFFLYFENFFNCYYPKNLIFKLPEDEKILNQWPASCFNNKFISSLSLFIKDTLKSFNKFNKFNEEERDFLTNIFSNYFRFSLNNLSLKEKTKKYEDLISFFESLKKSSLEKIEHALINFETVSLSLEKIDDFIDDETKIRSLELKKIAFIFIHFIYHTKIRSQFEDIKFNQIKNFLYFVLDKTGVLYDRSFFEKYSTENLMSFLNPSNDWDHNILLNLLKQYNEAEQAITQIASYKNRLECISDWILNSNLFLTCRFTSSDYHFFEKELKSYLNNVFKKLKLDESIEENFNTLDNLLTNLESLLNRNNFNFLGDDGISYYSFQIQKDILDHFEMISKIIDFPIPINPINIEFITTINGIYKTIKNKFHEEINFDLILSKLERLFYEMYNRPLFPIRKSLITSILYKEEIDMMIDNFNIVLNWFQNIDFRDEKDDFDVYQLLISHFSTIRIAKENEAIKQNITPDLDNDIIYEIKKIWNIIAEEIGQEKLSPYPESQNIEKQFHKFVMSQLLSSDISEQNQMSIIQKVQKLYTSSVYQDSKIKMALRELMFRSKPKVSQFEEHVSFRTELLFSFLKYYSKLAPYFSNAQGRFNIDYNDKRYLGSGTSSYHHNNTSPIKAHVTCFQKIKFNSNTDIPLNQTQQKIINFLTSNDTILIKVGKNQIPANLAVSFYQPVDLIYELVTTSLEEDIREKLPSIVNKLILNPDEHSLRNAKIKIVTILLNKLKDPTNFLQSFYPFPSRLRSHINMHSQRSNYDSFNPEKIFTYFKEALTTYYHHASELMQTFEINKNLLINKKKFDKKINGEFKQKVFKIVHEAKRKTLLQRLPYVK